MIRGANLVSVSSTDPIPRNASTYICQASIWYANPNVEKKNQPRLWVHESLDHLFLLEYLTFYTRLVRTNSVDGDRLLSFRDELRLDWIVRSKYAHDDCPHTGHCSCDPEEISPFVGSRNESNCVPNGAREADT